MKNEVKMSARRKMNYICLLIRTCMTSILLISCNEIASLRVDNHYDVSLSPSSPELSSIRPKFDDSAWQIVETSSNKNPQIKNKNQAQQDQDRNSSQDNQSSLNINKTIVPRSGKLVEWDDDGQDLTDQRDVSLVRLVSSNTVGKIVHPSPRPLKLNLGTWNDFIFEDKPRFSSLKQQLHKPTGARQSNKLIYHGRVDHTNSSRIVDGIPLFVDIHRPVAINRRSYSKSSWSPDADKMGNLVSTPIISSFQKLKLDPYGYSMTTTGAPITLPTTVMPLSNVFKQATSPKINGSLINSDTSVDQKGNSSSDTELGAHSQPEPTSLSSDWRPLVVVATRWRRSDKKLTENLKSKSISHQIQETHPLPTASSSFDDEKSTKKQLLNRPLDYKWKPITKDSGKTERIFDLNKEFPSNYEEKDENFGKISKSTYESVARSLARHPNRSTSTPSSIEVPFDDELGGLVSGSEKSTLESRSSSGIQATKLARDEDGNSDISNRSIPRITNSNKWTPLGVPTTVASDLETSSTTISPTTTTTTIATSSTANNSSGEANQRSASDLNYIYSSQPLVGQSAVGGGVQTSGSYYSNYVMQPTIQQDQLPATIVDTTSGQTPEMIADRTPAPEIAPPVQQPSISSTYDYSMPQSVASFQPIQMPLPSRQPPVSYGGYDSATNYYGGQQPARQQIAAQPVRQVNRQTEPTSSPQVVRQEHHYHYYNSNQQPPNDQRQLALSPSPAPQQQQTVIRELQPIMISQPIVQQTSTTTVAPPPAQQIIREIIKEVPMPMPIPMQPIQLQRLVMPQQIPIPQMVTREQLPPPESAYASSGALTSTTQRIIRQLSNSVPQVAIRMPSLPLFVRSQIPGQMPIRAAPPNQPPVTRQTGSFVIPPMPKKTTTYLTETQAMPSHTTIMQTTQFTPATRTTVYTTDHQLPTDTQRIVSSSGGAYKR